MAQVLLVENDSVIAELVADELAAGGHMVDVARTGPHALNKLRTRRSDSSFSIRFQFAMLRLSSSCTARPQAAMSLRSSR